MKRLLLPALAICALVGSALTGTGPASASAPAPQPTQPTQLARPAPRPVKPTPLPERPLLTAPKDTTAPGPVTNLQLTANTVNSVSLGWLNPADTDLAHLVVRRAAGGTAPAAGQGTLVATVGAAKTAVTDSGLAAASTYSYAVFATDKSGNQSTPATITVSTASTDSRTGLRGTLTDGQGRGIGNVLVHVRLGTVDAADTVTTSTGTYSVTNLVPGSYTVCYEPKSNVGGRSATGYVAGCYHQQPYGPFSNPTPVKVTLGSITSRVDDTLPLSGAVTGRITGPDGSPVAGVLVSTSSYVGGSLYFTVLTAADGSYTVKNLPPNNSYTFCYDPSQATGGYLYDCDYYDYVQPAAGQLVTLNHTLDVGGIVTGTVRNPAGSPVAGVSVQSFSSGYPAVTDATGHYRVTGLRSGTYYFCADGSAVPAGGAAPYGYLNGCGYLPSVPVDVQVNHTVTQDFTLTRYGALGGTLTRPDGSPAAQASVYLSSSDGYDGGFLQTDSQGHWQQREVPGRQYYACYIDYADQSTLWTCHQGQPWSGGQSTGDLIPVTEGALTTVNDSLLLGATLTGTVTGPDGAAFENAVVTVGDLDGHSGGQAITDAGGHYSLTGLWSGTYRVCFGGPAPATGPGYPYQCYQGTTADEYPYALQLTAGRSAVLDWQLAVGSAIAGRVTDADGNPMPGVQVRLTGPTATPVAYTDADGKYYLDQLIAGDYTVCFDPYYVYPQPDNGYVGSCWHDRPPNSGGDPVHAVAGVVSTGIDATMLIGGRVTGTVTDSAGNPVGGMTVQVLYPDGTLVTSTFSDPSDGSYQLAGLPAVPVAVCAVPTPWDPYRPACYTHAADYTTANLVTAASGATVSGIDLQLADSAATAADRSAAHHQG